MPEPPSYQSDTCDDLLDLSRANAQAVILGTALFLEKSDIPLSAWVASLGELFASSWDYSLELSAGEFLDAVLTNFRSLGAEVLAADLDGDRATASITGFPKRELCRELGVSEGSAEPYLDIPIALALQQGIDWSWERDGPRITLIAERSES